MRKGLYIISIIGIIMIVLTSCGEEVEVTETQTSEYSDQTIDNAGVAVQTDIAPQSTGKYVQITQEEAKAYMDGEEPVVILDVRTYEEYDEGHIEGALCIPVESMGEQSRPMIEQFLISKDQIILVYCRSGNRSKTASQYLADIGYTNVMEFGGIKDWKYGTVK